MIATPPRSFLSVASNDPSQDQHKGKPMEQSFQNLSKKTVPDYRGPCGGGRNGLTHVEAMQARVIAALWRAWPEAISNNDLANRAAPYFRRADGRAIDPKTVRQWLDGVSMPRGEFVLVLIGIVGADFFGLPNFGNSGKAGAR